MVQEATFSVPHQYEITFLIKSHHLDEQLQGVLTVRKVQEIVKNALIPEQPWGNTAVYLLILSVIALILLTKFTTPEKIRKKFRRSRPPAAPLTIILMMLLFSVGHVFAHSEHEEGDGVEGFSGVMVDKPKTFPDGTVYLPKSSQHLIGIQTEIVKPQIVKIGVKLSGHVQANPNYAGQVQAAQTGRVEVVGKTLPHIGEWVEKNQLLIRISSIAARFEQGNQQAQLATLENALQLARNRLARLKKLSGTIPRKTLDEAKSEVKSLKGRYEAVSRSLILREPLYAPISGFITKAAVLPGQIVEARETLFEIMNPEKLQIEALAYDNFQTLQIEQAEVVIDNAHSIPLTSLGRGTVLRGHALPLLFDVDMKSPPLSVGQVVNVIITTSQKIRGLRVPRDSLVKSNLEKDIIWLHSEAELFEPVQVEWQTVDDESIVITTSLPKGSRIVTRHGSRLLQIR
jgi:multidrug efflux pump subunit AcrA (membrane-fusion protein)